MPYHSYSYPKGPLVQLSLVEIKCLIHGISLLVGLNTWRKLCIIIYFSLCKQFSSSTSHMPSLFFFQSIEFYQFSWVISRWPLPVMTTNTSEFMKYILILILGLQGKNQIRFTSVAACFIFWRVSQKSRTDEGIFLWVGVFTITQAFLKGLLSETTRHGSCQVV